jgi:hypothetical protein
VLTSAVSADLTNITLQCDEQRPSCSACVRLDLTCDYRKSQAPALPTTTTTHSPSPLELATHPYHSTQGHLWDTGDLQLLHHFTTCHCVLAPGEHRRRIWTQDIVNAAFSQDYLLYQILAVSALHCLHQTPSRKEDLLAKAVRYRGRALQTVNPTLAHMTSELCIPVFAFAGLSMIYAFAEVATLRDREGQAFDPVRHVTACLQQNFGSMTVLQAYGTDIQDSWASELVDMNSDDDFERLSSSGLVFAHAGMLHSLLDRHERRPQYNTACHDALSVLLQTIQILMWQPEDHHTFHLINAWPSVLKPEFWELLEGKAPVALLVLAYFAALMSLRPNLWWFQLWPKLLFNKIEQSLDDEWQEALAWPKRFIESHRVLE